MVEQERSDAEIGLTGARFGRRRRRTDPPRAEPAAAVEPAPAVPAPRTASPPAAPGPASSTSVRPYVLTRGRTRSEFELAIETLVSARPGAGDPGIHRDIVELCRRPCSVAEIAALRGIPLGVAKVLLGDLAVSGAIVVHRTVDAAGPDLTLMQRVLRGLRRL